MFFVVNNVPEEKKAASLLTLIGGKMYALLKCSITPTKPTELSFKEIVDIMGKHLTLKLIIIAERYKFHKCNQEECEYEVGGYRDESLRDVQLRVWHIFPNNQTQAVGSSRFKGAFHLPGLAGQIGLFVNGTRHFEGLSRQILHNCIF